MVAEVAVLLPYRDAEATLGEALDSVLAQDGSALEVVAVDDGSVDSGAALVADRARRDPRVVPVRGEGRGIVHALGLAVMQTRAPLLARMDADDVCLPGRIAAQRALLLAGDRLGAAGTRVEAFPDAAVGEGLRRYVAWQNELISPEEHDRDLFVESPLCHPSVMMTREALSAAGGYRDGPFPEDYDLWLRMVETGYRLAKVPRVLLRWRHRPGRLTFSDPRYALDRYRELKAGFLARRLHASGRPVTLWGAGVTGRRLARALEPHGVTVERFVDIDPRKIGRTARGAPIASPESLMPGRSIVVVAVGARGARDQVRAHLAARGFTETADFICAS